MCSYFQWIRLFSLFQGQLAETSFLSKIFSVWNSESLWLSIKSLSWCIRKWVVSRNDNFNLLCVIKDLDIQNYLPKIICVIKFSEICLLLSVIYLTRHYHERDERSCPVIRNNLETGILSNVYFFFSQFSCPQMKPKLYSHLASSQQQKWTQPPRMMTLLHNHSEITRSRFTHNDKFPLSFFDLQL